MVEIVTVVKRSYKEGTGIYGRRYWWKLRTERPNGRKAKMVAYYLLIHATIITMDEKTVVANRKSPTICAPSFSPEWVEQSRKSTMKMFTAFHELATEVTAIVPDTQAWLSYLKSRSTLDEYIPTVMDIDFWIFLKNWITIRKFVASTCYGHFSMSAGERNSFVQMDSGRRRGACNRLGTKGHCFESVLEEVVKAAHMRFFST